jgi:hypothetical protein
VPNDKLGKAIAHGAPHPIHQAPALLFAVALHQDGP